MFDMFCILRTVFVLIGEEGVGWIDWFADLIEFRKVIRDSIQGISELWACRWRCGS